MNELLVVGEHRGNQLAAITLEMLSEGRKLADNAGARLCAVIIGQDPEHSARELAQWADHVIAVTDPRVPGALAEPYQQIMSSVIKERKPRLVLIGNSSFGMDLAPALAVDVGAPLVTDCTDIVLDTGSITVRRPLYNGKVDALYSCISHETTVVTVRLGQFPIEPGERKGIIERRESHLKEEPDYKHFLEYIEPVVGDVDITKSRILVSVGRGMKDKANVAMAEELAQVMGGELAASRPVVDSGWLGNERQVGLSGKTVKPDLYLALGISGAIQHLAGIKGAKKIIAINQDPSAPIFSIADYGIVDDLFKVLPLLIDRIKQKRDGDRSPGVGSLIVG